MGTHGMTGAPVIPWVPANDGSSRRRTYQCYWLYYTCFSAKCKSKTCAPLAENKMGETAHSSFSNSLSPYTFMPFSFSSAAVTPSPSVSVPVNVPS